MEACEQGTKRPRSLRSLARVTVLALRSNSMQLQALGKTMGMRQENRKERRGRSLHVRYFSVSIDINTRTDNTIPIQKTTIHTISITDTPKNINDTTISLIFDKLKVSFSVSTKSTGMPWGGGQNTFTAIYRSFDISICRHLRHDIEHECTIDKFRIRCTIRSLFRHLFTAYYRSSAVQQPSVLLDYVSFPSISSKQPF